MIMTNKLLPVALIAALIGGSVGALVMHKSQPATAETTTAQQNAPERRLQLLTRRTVKWFQPASTQQASRLLTRQASRTDSPQRCKRAENGSHDVTRRAPSRVVYRNSGSSRSSSARLLRLSAAQAQLLGQAPR